MPLKHPTTWAVGLILCTIVPIASLRRAERSPRVAERAPGRSTGVIETPSSAEPDPQPAHELSSNDPLYADLETGFSVRYPSDFTLDTSGDWPAIVNDSVNASLWIGLCPPGCSHPEALSITETGGTRLLTSEDSAEIPLGEGRILSVEESRELHRSDDTVVLEQWYTLSAIDLDSGQRRQLECGPDTGCWTTPRRLRYVALHPPNVPYVLIVRTHQLDADELDWAREVAATIAY